MARLNVGELFGTVTVDVTSAERGLQRVESGWRRLGSTIKTGALFIGGAFAGLAVAGGVMGLKTAASLQQADIAFATLLGSSDKAKSFLGDLKAFASKTPFELPGLIDSARLLIGVGVDAKNVIPVLKAFGDASGALGLSQDRFNNIMLATSQAISAGKFSTEDLNQITENGIPIWNLLSKALGKPVPELRKLAEAGKLTADQVLPALQQQMGKDYGGAMERQSRTLTGLWSTFMDTLGLGLADALTPLVPVLQDALPGAMAVLGDGLKVTATLLAALVSFIMSDALPAFAALARFIADNKVPIGIVAGLIAAVFIPHFIALGATATVTAAKTAAAWVVTQVNAVRAAAVHSFEILRMIGRWVALAVAAAAQAAKTAAAWLVTQTAAIRAAVVHAAQVLRMVAAWVLLGVQSMLNAARVALAWLIAMGPIAIVIAIVIGLVALIILNWDKIKEVTVRIWTAVKDWIVNAARFVMDWLRANWPLLLAIITGPIGLAVYFIVKYWDQIVAFTSGAWQAIVGAVKAGLDFIIGLVTTWWEIYSGIWRKVGEFLLGAVELWWRTFTGFWSRVIGFVASLPGRIASAARGMWDGIVQAFRGAANWLIGLWNRIDTDWSIRIPDWVPGIGGKGFTLPDLVPDLPYLAAGGIVPSRPGGMLAQLGEGRSDELVMPLARFWERLDRRLAQTGPATVFADIFIGEEPIARRVQATVRGELGNVARTVAAGRTAPVGDLT